VAGHAAVQISRLRKLWKLCGDNEGPALGVLVFWLMVLVGHTARLGNRKRRDADSGGAAGEEKEGGVLGGLGPAGGGTGPPSNWRVFDPQWVELSLREHSGWSAYDLLALLCGSNGEQ
jgi:hypothetical protein